MMNDEWYAYSHSHSTKYTNLTNINLSFDLFTLPIYQLEASFSVLCKA